MKMVVDLNFEKSGDYKLFFLQTSVFFFLVSRSSKRLPGIVSAFEDNVHPDKTA